VSDVRESHAPADAGEYCRRVEEHLTRANLGHLVRIAGPSFDLVRGWFQQGIPLSVVYRGIDVKADRHRERRSRHPLRIEFCEADVLTVFDQWRRAVGIVATGAPSEPAGDDRGLSPGDPSPFGDPSPPGAKRPSLAKHLERAVERLVRAAGRLEWPDPLRDACDGMLESVAELRRRAAGARGSARDAIAAELPALDAALASALRAHAPEADRLEARRDAEADLAPYRARLDPDRWQQAVEATADRLLRDRLGLPTLEL
jgi:hypothetical protein